MATNQKVPYAFGNLNSLFVVSPHRASHVQGAFKRVTKFASYKCSIHPSTLPINMFVTPTPQKVGREGKLISNWMTCSLFDFESWHKQKTMQEKCKVCIG